MKGIKRFRQAIKNQQDAGNGEFRLTYHDAEEIADEIDDEFLKVCGSAEREIGRYVWVHGVPAPVDADGKVVPLTTKVMYGDDGRELEIIFLKFNIHNPATYWAAFCKNKDGNRGYAAVSNIHLRRPDSWEKLEEDVQKVPGKGTCGYFGVKACDESCPAKCSPAACSTCVLEDILRRAKALAGRGED